MDILTLSVLVLLLFLIIGFSSFWYIIKQIYLPPYPPHLRGKIPSIPDFDGYIAPTKSWEKRLRVRVWEVEGKKIILFFHGWDSSSGFFSQYVMQFKEKGWTVVTVDLRSMGESERQALVSQIDFAEDIQQALSWVLEKYPSKSDITIYGHSIGGVSLILGLGWKIIDQSKLNQIVTEGIYADSNYLLNRMVNKFPFKSQIKPIFLKFLMIRLKQVYKNNPHKWVLNSTTNLDPFRQLNKIDVPLLMIHTENDEIVNYSETELFKLHKKANVRFLSFRTGGHFRLSYENEFFVKLFNEIE